MKFRKIDRILFFGGSRVLVELCARVSGKYPVFIFSCDRQLKEPVLPGGKTLERALKEIGVGFRSCDDINEEPELKPLITAGTLGIGLGEPWSFSAELIRFFDGQLLDLMGVRLPQYRGGAHYTWQILRGNRVGCCNLQFVNEKTVQGKFDSGEIVFSHEYLFPSSARIPEDYFKTAVANEVRFVEEFLSLAQSGHEFRPFSLQESFSMYLPRLHTLTQAWINWEWDTKEIESFICAFDDPYAGASTFLRGKRVFLKKCSSESNDGSFHPFQCGLVYKKQGGILYVASRSGTLVLQEARDESGRDLTKDVEVGQRFLTPRKILEDALAFTTDYSKKGLTKA